MAEEFDFVTPVIVIDCDNEPLVPWGQWVVEEHVKGGIIKLDDMAKIELYLTPQQRNSNWPLNGRGMYQRIRGKPTKELRDKLILNASILDVWLANPELIPGAVRWACQVEKKEVFFWNTIYRHRTENARGVRYLFHGIDNLFRGHLYCFNQFWGPRQPMAVMADSQSVPLSSPKMGIEVRTQIVLSGTQSLDDVRAATDTLGYDVRGLASIVKQSDDEQGMRCSTLLREETAMSGNRFGLISSWPDLTKEWVAHLEVGLGDPGNK